MVDPSGWTATIIPRLGGETEDGGEGLPIDGGTGICDGGGRPGVCDGAWGAGAGSGDGAGPDSDGALHPATSRARAIQTRIGIFNIRFINPGSSTNYGE